ncbi:MAG: hypothetical protein P8Y02_00425 [Deinococcales bacterium]|jgi:hypothetical protein
MRPREHVWLHDDRGTHVTAAVPPAAWRGERGCVVGPFSNAQCARTFLLLRHRGGGGTRIFPAGPAFYVEMLT